MPETIQVPLEQLIQLFEHFYPTEFKHCLAEARAAWYKKRVAELEDPSYVDPRLDAEVTT